MSRWSRGTSTTYRHVLVASPQLVQRLGKPTSPDDPHRFPCAVWCRDVSARGVWQLGDQTLEPRLTLSTNSYLHLRSLALAGEVVTELSPFLAAQGIRDGQLRTLLPKHLLPEQQVHLLYPSHRHPSSIVRAYLDYCQNHLPHHLGGS